MPSPPTSTRGAGRKGPPSASVESASSERRASEVSEHPPGDGDEELSLAAPAQLERSLLGLHAVEPLPRLRHRGDGCSRPAAARQGAAP